ncbi:hypothetical protein SERLA73DRAFT_28729, partial [Serpula lacrymans var. lacrymans S7.3]
FFYAADYPEKSFKNSCIKFLGNCPCPRCFITKEKISQLGSKLDRLRCKRDVHIDGEQQRTIINRVWTWIFEKGRSLGSSAVK